MTQLLTSHEFLAGKNFACGIRSPNARDNGDGTFQTAVSYISGAPSVSSVAVADVNGDGHPDLLLAATECPNIVNCEDGAVSVLLGNGVGTFPVVVNDADVYDTVSLAVADVNSDGHPDLLLANVCASISNCTNGVANVLLGNGDGTFGTTASYNSGAVP
jgi:hypothetical protein